MVRPFKNQFDWKEINFLSEAKDWKQRANQPLLMSCFNQTIRKNKTNLHLKTQHRASY